MDDDAILKVVTRLSRGHQSGGRVIERAAILAEGGDCAAILAWITAHDGQPEAPAPVASGRGLHSSRLYPGAGGASQPRRYVLPAGALAQADPARATDATA
jgi:hypothetical protein